MTNFSIDSLSTDTVKIKIPLEIKQKSNLNIDNYTTFIQKAKRNNNEFWADLAREYLIWDKNFTKILDESNAPFYTWFNDGNLSVSYNCLDKNVEKHPNKIAFIFESDDGKTTKITYQELLDKVCSMSNALKNMGFYAGQRAVIYMPMTIEAIIAIHACIRIGMIHSVVFAGFSAKSLNERIVDAGASVIFTTDEQFRGGKTNNIKNIVDEALTLGNCESIKKVIVYQRTNNAKWNNKLDIWWHEAIKNQSSQCAPIVLPAEHPLFILYTSGSTGKPKGVQHSSAGYLLHSILTMLWTFDIKEDDIFWCTADVGWITGHTYVAYGPLACGITQIIFEGVPTYPDAARFWQIIQKYKVSLFYTAPTAIRALIKASSNDDSTHPKHFDLSSLRLLGSVGEPINPKAWEWYYKYVGNQKCPIVDTWWQTETGGHIMTPLIGIHDLKAGSCAMPIPGIEVDIVDEEGNSQDSGYLVIKKPWPSMIRTIWNDNERFKKTYFPEQFGGKYYLAGDGAYRDNDGYYWIMGRIDDVLNVSGHRLGTIEIESALVLHNNVAEAAVVGRPNDITGEEIVAFVVLKQSNNTSSQELQLWVAQQIGAIARPKEIRFGEALPKTRSGKIMRRLLKSIAKGEDITQDISTLENPQILQGFIEDKSL